MAEEYMEEMEGMEEIEVQEHDLMELFDELSFKEKWARVMEGLKMPQDTGEYKWARLQMIRLSAPAAAVVVPVIMLLLVMVLAAIKPPAPNKVEVTIMEPEPIEELEEIEEIIEEPPEPPDPVEIDFTPNMTVDTPNPQPPTEFSPVPAKFDSVAMVKSPVIMKNIYGSRSPGHRGSARAAYGGNGATEGAVMRALRWLKKYQSSEGYWSGAADGGGAGGKHGNAYSGFTGMGLLTFLAHGETPASPEFGATVERAIRYLVESQDGSGLFSAKDGHNYSHPIAAYALCEAYGLTKVPMILEAAEKAIQVIIKGQHPSGGWDYNCKQSNRDDTSYMGWCAQALKAAYMAGVMDTDPALKAAMKKAIDGFKKNSNGSGFGYCGPSTSGLTGVGVLCMQLLGAANDAHCKGGLQAMADWHMDWAGGGGAKLGKSQVYYTYYITQAKFHHGGETWNSWNKEFAPQLVRGQSVVPAAQAGYVDHKGQPQEICYWDSTSKAEHTGGRTQDTCLCALQLQVYYRYLPTFKKVDVEHEEEQAIAADDDIDIEVL